MAKTVLVKNIKVGSKVSLHSSSRGSILEKKKFQPETGLWILKFSCGLWTSKRVMLGTEILKISK